MKRRWDIVPRRKFEGSVRHTRTTMCLRVLLAAAVTSVPLSAIADEANEISLQKVERELNDSRAAKRNLQRKAQQITHERIRIRKRLIKMAKKIQTREDRLLTSEKRLRELSSSEKELSQALKGRQTELSRVLGSLSRLQRAGTPLLVVGPGTPLQNMRASLLLTSITPELERRVGNIRAQIETLRQLRQQIAEERRDIDLARRELETEKRRLSQLLRAKSNTRNELLARAQQEEKRITALSNSASNIGDLVERLHKDRNTQTDRGEIEKRISVLRQTEAQTPEISAPEQAIEPSARADSKTGTGQVQQFASLRGQLPLPARGQIVEHFGDDNGYGPASKGIRIQTRPHAQVITPFDGEVSYAGEFRGYGQLLIIAHGQGYHTLLAGMSRIDVVVGQLLLASEPVGEMGNNERKYPNLYVELRYRGEAVNPLPWLAMNIGKVKG